MTSAPPPGYTPPPAPPSQPLAPPPPSGGRGTGIGIVIGVLVFALIAGGAFAVVKLRDAGTGTTGGSAKPLPSEPLPSTDPALATFYDQKLDWSSCGDNECADLSVPLDYAKPDGKTAKIALVKVPATGKSLGPLVVNPGGPGGSGIQYALSGAYAFSQGILEHYDVVGFDPRGVGQSTPLTCLDTEQMDAFLAQDQDPDNAAERAAYARSVTAFGDACLKNSGSAGSPHVDQGHRPGRRRPAAGARPGQADLPRRVVRDLDRRAVRAGVPRPGRPDGARRRRRPGPGRRAGGPDPGQGLRDRDPRLRAGLRRPGRLLPRRHRRRPAPSGSRPS